MCKDKTVENTEQVLDQNIADTVCFAWWGLVGLLLNKRWDGRSVV